MIRALFIASTGMMAQKMNIEVISHNLANVNTVGYKKARADFQDLMYQTVRSPGTFSSETSQLPSGIMVGLGVRPVSVEKIFQEGDFMHTGNSLDLAIEGEGFFQILLPDGNVAYTRSGNFKVDREGRLVTSEGYPLEPEITIPADTESITIGVDGRVSVIQSGSTEPVELGQIEISRFVNPAGLKPIGRNLYLATDASGEPITGTPGSEGLGTISQGFLEMSNVNIVDEMIKMITAQRAFEISSKVVQAVDEMLQYTNNLRR